MSTSLHVIIGARPSPSLFLHGCKTKAGVGRTGNEATHEVHLCISVPEAGYVHLQVCISVPK